MKRTERMIFTMPDELPTTNRVGRVDPNNGFPSDAGVHVFTDDGHMLSFKILKKGPEQPDYLISLVSAEPPITTNPPLEKEIYVRDDIIIEGKEITLDSVLPIIIGRETLRVVEILSNIEMLIVPLDGQLISGIDDIQEII